MPGPLGPEIRRLTSRHIMGFLVRLFRRETTSKEFIPVIDGLRFVAIAMVVFYHTDAYILEKSSNLKFDTVGPHVSNYFIFGHQGVQLFFAISGFILTIPFMRYYLGLNTRKPTLAAYFSRRLTRLEPPYIISTLIFFALIVFVTGSQFPISTLIESLFASLFYVHNFVFPGIFPLINGVTWSLEIEVQYYILAPFVIWALCQIRNNAIRRSVTFALMIAFAVLAWLLDVYWAVGVLSLLSFLQYFFAGILLCDVYLVDAEILRPLDHWYVFLIGMILLGLLTGFEHAYSTDLLIRIASPILVLAFYLIVFGNGWWRRFFSLSILTSIGGMCYTIYLLHYVTISGIGRVTINRLMVSNFTLYYSLQVAILVVGILAVSGVYFLLIEKPCMKRDWHIRLYTTVKNTIFGSKELKDTFNLS